MAAMDPLIDTEELALRLDEVRLFDIRWSLTDPTHGVAAYEKGHIPGAVFADLDSDLSAASGPGRHPLPSATDFAAALGTLGVSPNDEVVVYDDVSGVIAARMWWMLRSIGHGSSRLLDGGLAAWVAEGRETDSGPVIPSPTLYPTPSGFTGVVTIDDLQGRTILDARSCERYRGETEPADPKAGHIPGAISMPTSSNLDETGRFGAPSEVAVLYEAAGPAPVMSCGSGVTACHDALAMVVAGLGMPDVYIGSFSEWSRLDLPVATGPKP